MASCIAKANRAAAQPLSCACGSPPPPPPPEPLSCAAPKAMDFLVIDDDMVFREATCLLIEDEGHRASAAATAEVALSLLREEKYDAALLDLNLGRDNGLVLLPQILKIRPNLPIVMFSAQGTVKKAVQAIQLGAVDFLEKPFTREQFHTVLARVKKFTQMGTQIERLEQEVKD